MKNLITALIIFFILSFTTYANCVDRYVHNYIKYVCARVAVWDDFKDEPCYKIWDKVTEELPKYKKFDLNYTFMCYRTCKDVRKTGYTMYVADLLDNFLRWCPIQFSYFVERDIKNIHDKFDDVDNDINIKALHKFIYQGENKRRR